MKTIFRVSILAVLLAVLPSPCFALWSVGPITKEQAKQLGMEVRSNAAGTNGVAVELEIKTEGKFETFANLDRADRSRVELQINKGDVNLVSATLKEERSKPGHVVVRFTADRAQLEMITLRVWVDTGHGGVINELPMRDFIDGEKAH